MSLKIRHVASAVGALLALSACEVSKSSNPLSPSIAGPIAGVNISAPKTMQPSADSRIAVDQQPVTLAVANAASSGVRPLTYLFQVSVDSSFSTVIYSKSGVAPGEGQTSLQLPDALETGRTYYWRARAEDGANTGEYSPPAAFQVYTPIVIQAPVPTAPINNVVTDSIRPRFSFTDAPKSGPYGAITYAGEVSDSQSFANIITIWSGPEQPGQTSIDSPQDLPYSKQLFWRVRASDPTTVGPWSATQLFQTPAAPVAAPPPSGGGGGGGGSPAANDGINMSQATVVNNPADLASWAVTTAITRLDLRADGVHVEFSKKDGPGRWPDVYPPNFGDIQYTLGMALKINGQWYVSAVIEFWYGLDASGGPVQVPGQIPDNWYYSAGRWGPMAGYQPRVGEMVGFFVAEGDLRDSKGPWPLRERSNVVVIPMPAAGGGSFSF